MIIEVSLIIIATCLVLFIVVAIIVGVSLHKSLKNIDEVITSVEFKLDNALDEVSTTLCQATTALGSINALTVSVTNKIEKTDPIFNSISKVGEIAGSYLTGTHEIKVPKIFSFGATEKKEKFNMNDVAEVIGVGINLWQKFKKRI